MARITVEDCLENVDNRFNLVLIAAKRARQLAEGYQSELDVKTIKTQYLLSVKSLLAISIAISLLMCRNQKKQLKTCFFPIASKQKSLAKLIRI